MTAVKAEKYRTTINAHGKRFTSEVWATSLTNAIAATRQDAYRGMCEGDMLTDIAEGRVPIVKTEVEVIDESKDTLDYTYVPVNMAGLYAEWLEG